MTKNFFLFTLIIVLGIVFITVVVPIFNLRGGEGTVPTDAPPGNSSTTVSFHAEAGRIPIRDWSVLDPKLSAEGVLMQSLDGNFSLYRLKAYAPWRLASLTKLITAVVVVENVGLDKKIPISTTTMTVDGEAGNFRAGEIYKSEDLLKIMLMESSNRAAAAFEEYIGNDRFLAMARAKLAEIGMTQTVINDSSGLDDNNRGTPNDMYMLLKYIVEKDPEILTWTRLTTQNVQPLNSSRINVVSNIDPIVARIDFLGGKTGTSPLAKQNLATVLEIGNQRLISVIMGSDSRFDDLNTLIDWVSKSYKFQ